MADTRRAKLRCAVVLAPGEYTGGRAAEVAPPRCPPCIHELPCSVSTTAQLSAAGLRTRRAKPLGAVENTVLCAVGAETDRAKNLSCAVVLGQGEGAGKGRGQRVEGRGTKDPPRGCARIPTPGFPHFVDNFSTRPF